MDHADEALRTLNHAAMVATESGTEDQGSEDHEARDTLAMVGIGYALIDNAEAVRAQTAVVIKALEALREAVADVATAVERRASA